MRSASHSKGSIIVTPSSLSGVIKIPPSKSQTLRAMVFALLSEGISTIVDPLISPDVDAMAAACRLLGAEVDDNGHTLRIKGVGLNLKVPNDVIYCGNSGIVLRFIGAIASLIEGCTVLTGDHSVRNSRPAQPLLDGINQLGGKALSTRGNGQAPLIIQGRLSPGAATIDGQDSQPVSALLIAASCLDGPSEIAVLNPGETPWIDLTLQWLKKMGAKCRHEDYRRYHVAGNAAYTPFEYHVPGDWSTAAFPVAAALVTRSSITLTNVDYSDAQGDKNLIDCLKAMGAKIELCEADHALKIHPTEDFYGADIDVNDFIDALPVLAVIGCFAKTPTRIYNGAIARRKESDRISTIAHELAKMGADIEERGDGLIINPSILKGCDNLDCRSDHRITLALTVAGLGAEGNSKIGNSECIAKTYPGFGAEWNAIGAMIKSNTLPENI